MAKKIGVIFVFGFLLAGYVLAGLLGMQAHRDPIEMDTTFYLSAAYQIKETGGVFQHIQNCIRGIYREATQHPAYLLILSCFAEKNVHFFINAKIATFILGFLLLLVYFYIVRNLFCAGTALIAVCFLVASATFLNLSTMVACETLLVIFFLLFWFFAAKGFDKGRYWLGAGFFASAAFLTKSLGILTLPIFLIAVFVIFTRKKSTVFLNKYCWGFLAIFFIFASPLLIRNLKVFGTPFYSDSSSVLWMDRWNDYYKPEFKKHPPTFSGFVKTHGLTGITSIFATGLFVRNPKMISDGLKPFAFWEKPINLQQLQGFYERSVGWQEIWAVLLCLLFFLGLWRERRSHAAVLALSGTLLFLLFVGWYSKVFPGNPPTRLLYPVLFFVYIFASKTLLDLGNALFSKIKISGGRYWVLAFTGCFAIFFFISLLIHSDWQKIDIKKSYMFTNPFVAELRWVDEHLQTGERIMAGTVFMKHLFYFEEKIMGKVVPWPAVENFGELESYIRGQSVRYGILDLATVAYNLKVYKPYFNVGPKIGLQSVEDLPRPFKKISEDLNIPPMYEIYEYSQSL